MSEDAEMKRELDAIWREQKEMRGLVEKQGSVLERMGVLMEGAYGSGGLFARLEKIESQIDGIKQASEARVRQLEIKVYTISGSMVILTPLLVILVRLLLK